MKIFTIRLLSVALLSAASATAQSAISVYISPDGVQSAETSGILGVTPEQIFTENFNSIPTGSLTSYTSPTIGVTYTASSGAAAIQPNDQYGGFGEGNYLGINGGRSTTMLIDNAAQYFGFYFSAGDANNQIDIYSGSELLLSFSTATLMGMLPNTAGSEITAINGDKYLTQNYYGQPTSGRNATEPYAYLHFVTEGATSFDRIVLSQGTGSPIFENDNHSILTTAPVIPDSLVKVPEPSAFLLSSIGVLALLSRRRR